MGRAQVTSRDFFEEIRAGVWRIKLAEDEIEAAREAVEVKTQRYAASVQGGNPDHTAAIDSIIERERELDHLRAETNQKIELALCLLYGNEQDGRGGVAAEKGNIYADAVCSVYLMGRTHRDTADELGCTRSWVTSLCTATFNHIDRRTR